MHYTSPLHLLGLPLVEVRIGAPGQDRGLAGAWIAIGDVAFGLLFAGGGPAIAGAVAQGGKAIAPQANDAFAIESLARAPFFRLVQPVLRWAWVLLLLPVVVTPLLSRRRVRDLSR